MTLEKIEELAKITGGTIDEVELLPDGSGFATMSMPLPDDHWLYADNGEFETPPMSLKCGIKEQCRIELNRNELAERITAACRYAIRSTTMNGKDNDFDPDALVQNMVVGMLGYWTRDGLSQDEWANPDQ